MYTVLKSRQKWNGIKTLSYACQFCDAEDLGLNSFLYRQQKNKKRNGKNGFQTRCEIFLIDFEYLD